MVLEMKTQKFATRKWYIIYVETKGNYLPNEETEFINKSLESTLCDYFDAYVLVTGNITIAGSDVDRKATFKNCAPFTKCRTQINDTFVCKAENNNITMPMYNLIKYSGNYSYTSGSLWQFKRDEQPKNNNRASINLTTENSSSFKYKLRLIGNLLSGGGNATKTCRKIAFPLKYLSFFKDHQKCHQLIIKLNQICILSSVAADSTFAITDGKRLLL